MNSEEALKFINQLFVDHKKLVLNELEEKLFVGFWEEKIYDEIITENNYSIQYLREKGPELCRRIRKELGIDVKKTNFKNPIKYRYQQHLEQKVLEQPERSQVDENVARHENANINPFIPLHGRVENPEEFFNREKELRQVFEHLNSYSSVVLIGEEGVGKSSLLWAIKREAEIHLQLMRQPVFLDLNVVDDEDEFYSELCHEVGIPECKGNKLNRALRDKRVLLLLDNVGKMTEQGFTRQMRDKLRGLAEGSQAPLKLVLAASESLKDLFNDSYNTSPLAGICQEVYIEPWDEATGRDFISRRLAKTSVSFTEEEIIKLVEESGGHPRRLMQLCYENYARYREGMK